jgi:hypothetical protein
MAIPQGYTLIQWYNVIVSDLLSRANKLDAAAEIWPILTTAQKNQVKTAVNNTLDDAIAKLTALKADVTAL